MGKLTLSFDNGPDPGITPRVLDILERQSVRATFFVIGEKLARHRPLAEDAHRRGHWIGNHTWTHSVPLGERDEPGLAEAEIGRVQDQIGGLAHPDRLFRPFGRQGRLGAHLLRRDCADFLVTGGYTCVLWNCIPRDWEDMAGWPATTLAACRAQDWTLVVLHDLPTGAMDHLEAFIAAARDGGVEIVQDLPPACLPIRRGAADPSLARYVTG